MAQLAGIDFTLQGGALNAPPTNNTGYSALVSISDAALPQGRYSAAADIEAAASDASVTLSDETLYNINGYFSRFPGSQLTFVQLAQESSLQSDLVQLQIDNNYQIRQFAVYGPEQGAETDVEARLTAVGQAMEELRDDTEGPAVALVAPDTASHDRLVASTGPLVTNAPTLSADRRFVTLIDWGDADAVDSSDDPLNAPCVGHLLGLLAASTVSQSIGRTADLLRPLSNGSEFNSVFIGAANYTALRLADLEAIKDLQVPFPIQHVQDGAGRTGFYPDNDFTLAPATGAEADFNRLSTNRALQDARRDIYVSLFPFIGRDWLVDPDTGLLNTISKNIIIDAVSAGLGRKVAAGVISGFTVQIPDADNADFYSTGILSLKVRITKNGISEVINVNYGLTAPNTTA